jgi:hypothetical protein
MSFTTFFVSETLQTKFAFSNNFLLLLFNALAIRFFDSFSVFLGDGFCIFYVNLNVSPCVIFHFFSLLFSLFKIQYIIGDSIPFYIDSIGPYNNPQETYSVFFYFLTQFLYSKHSS